MTDGPLADMRVLELATVVAGPGAGRHLADLGAKVVKVERPGSGDGTRAMGWQHPDDGVGLWWKLLGRGKRSITLDLKSDQGRETTLALAAEADAVIENFRPGGLERLGLGPEVLLDANPSLVITRVSGFGQDGPYAGRPGFATLAEAMSGFAAINGDPDGPPLLPPMALTDEVTALVAAFATLAAMRSGVGQVVDVNLIESMLQLMGPLPLASAVHGYDQPRLGAGIPYSVPRGTYLCKDGRWVAVSTSAEPVARRVLDLIGLGHDERLRSMQGRVDHRGLVDGALADWIRERTLEEVMEAFHLADAAIAPVLTMSELLADPHIVERGVMIDVDGVPMPRPVAGFSATPTRVRWAGPPLGADDDVPVDELFR